MKTEILQNPVLQWRLAGAGIWQGVAVSAFVLFRFVSEHDVWASPWRLLFGWLSISVWINTLSVILAQTPAFLGHALTITTEEATSPILLRLPWLPTPAAVLVAKLAARLSSVPSALRYALSIAGHLASAVLTFSALGGVAGAGLGWTILYSCCLTTIYLGCIIFWSRDVLCFPIIQRHRYFRIKQRIPFNILNSLYISIFSALATTALDVVLGRSLPSFSAVITALTAGTTTAFCWLMGTAILEVVFTERLRPDDYGAKDVLTAMAACLTGSNGVIMRDLTLHDAALMGRDTGKAAWRRVDVFRDDSGGRWIQLAEPCLLALQEVTGSMAGALPQKGGAGGAGASKAEGGSGRSVRKWNALPYVASMGGLATGRQQVIALLQVQSNYQRAVHATHCLADFAVASVTEDRLGLLQIVDPGLGRVMQSLLSALLATQQLQRQLGSAVRGPLAPWRGSGDGQHGVTQADAVLHALHDVLRNAVYAVVGAFGQELVGGVEGCKAQPVHGSTPDLIKLLKQCLAAEL